MFATTASILILAVASVQAGVFLTNPTAATTFTAGQPTTITWQDDGKQPDLKAFGPAKISIYVGNAQQQTFLQSASESVDVSTATSVSFTPDAKIGPNGNQYFIRVESLALKDGQFPALAFSAKFTMAGMTGTFSPAIQAQIDGQSSAPLAGATTAGATTPAATPTNASTPGSSAKPSSTSAKPSGSSTAKPSNAAVAHGAVSFTSLKMWAGALVGVAVGAMIC
jgi:hypothetical protein